MPLVVMAMRFMLRTVKNLFPTAKRYKASLVVRFTLFMIPPSSVPNISSYTDSLRMRFSKIALMPRGLISLEDTFRLINTYESRMAWTSLITPESPRMFRSKFR